MPNATSAGPGRVALDWRHGQISTWTWDPQTQAFRGLTRCVLCGRPALSRSPVKDVPCHKACAEAWISAHARDAGHREQLIRAYTPRAGGR